MSANNTHKNFSPHFRNTTRSLPTGRRRNTQALISNGITKSCTCRLTMEDYIRKILIRYGHPAPCKPQRSTHQHHKIIYGTSIQKPLEEDTSHRLDAAGIKHIQGIFGMVLYHARAVNNKLLTNLSSIGSEQAKATQATNKAANHLLEYLATYPNDGITYRFSNMVLATHSNAAHLNETRACSRSGSHIFSYNNYPTPRKNVPVLSLAQIINVVMSSSSEA